PVPLRHRRAGRGAPRLARGAPGAHLLDRGRAARPRGDEREALETPLRARRGPRVPRVRQGRARGGGARRLGRAPRRARGRRALAVFLLGARRQRRRRGRVPRPTGRGARLPRAHRAGRVACLGPRGRPDGTVARLLVRRELRSPPNRVDARDAPAAGAVVRLAPAGDALAPAADPLAGRRAPCPAVPLWDRLGAPGGWT